MKISSLIFIFFILINCAKTQTTLVAGDLKVSLDKQGNFTEITDNRTAVNYLYRDTLAPFIALIANQKRYLPQSLKYDGSRGIITLTYPEIKAKVEVKVMIRKNHLTFEVTKAEPADRIDGLVWGPIPTKISKTVGEIIGVVRDNNVGLGIQVLNPKTLGGDYNKEGMTWSKGEAAV